MVSQELHQGTKIRKERSNGTIEIQSLGGLGCGAACRKVNGPGVFVWLFAQWSGVVFAVWGHVLNLKSLGAGKGPLGIESHTQSGHINPIQVSSPYC